MRRLTKLMTLVVVALVASLAMAGAAWADGTDGKITVDNATVGVTYSAYKVLDATISGDAIAYTTDASHKDVLSAADSPFTVSSTADANGNYAVTQKSGQTAETIGAWIKQHKSSFAEVNATSGLDADKKATGNKVEFGNLAYGYYYIESGLGAVVTLDSANKTATVKDKNPQQPDGPTKVITAEDAVIADSDQAGLTAESNDAAVGTKQSFSTTYNATNYVTSGSGEDVASKLVTKFYIDDQPTNMTIDLSTVNVIVGDKKGNVTVIENGAVKDATNYPATVSLATGDAGKLSITINWVDSNNNSLFNAIDGTATIPVTLTYDATILPGAATQNADNTVTVKYDRAGEPNTDLGSDKTDTFTYHFKLTKTDAQTNEGLKGAKFELTLGSTKVSLIDVKGDGSVYRVAGTGETGTTTIDMKENSEIEIQGLDKKDYTLTEIQPPDGYNLLGSPVNIVGDNLKKATEAADQYTVDVDNNKGTELPSTGGIGTTILYIIGAVLVIGAGVFLVTKRRMRKEDNVQE